MYKIAVLTVSDRCSREERADQSGKDIIDILKKIGSEIVSYDVVPDEIDLIRKKLVFYCDNLKADFVFTTFIHEIRVDPIEKKCYYYLKVISGIQGGVRGNGCMSLVRNEPSPPFYAGVVQW